MIQEDLEKIINTLTESLEDAEKSQNGNASAGRRIRRVCMDVIHELKALRKKVLEKDRK